MAQALRKGELVYRMGFPAAVGQVVRIEAKDDQRLVHVAAVPEHAAPWLEVWPEQECVRA